MHLFIHDINDHYTELMDSNKYTIEELKYISKQIKENGISYGLDEEYRFVKERIEFVSDGNSFDNGGYVDLCFSIYVEKVV